MDVILAKFLRDMSLGILYLVLAISLTVAAPFLMVGHYIYSRLIK